MKGGSSDAILGEAEIEKNKDLLYHTKCLLT